MSSIASLYEVPTAPEEWAQWAFAHAVHHIDINRRIYEIVGLNLPEFVLDPFDPGDPEQWLQNHQTMHFNMDTVLSISPFSLQQVAFTDPRQTQGWIFLNATEHKLAADALGIG